MLSDFLGAFCFVARGVAHIERNSNIGPHSRLTGAVDSKELGPVLPVKVNQSR